MVVIILSMNIYYYVFQDFMGQSNPCPYTVYNYIDRNIEYVSSSGDTNYITVATLHNTCRCILVTACAVAIV